MKIKIRKNDEVIVISGKDKGKRGKVSCIYLNGKAIVQGVNLVTKHQKLTKFSKQSNGIIKKEAKINISNLAIFNKKTNKPDKISFRIEKNRKIRIFKSTKKII